MENIDFSLTEVFHEVLSRRQTQGALTFADYETLVDEVLEEKRELGEMDDEVDIEQARQELIAKWNEVADADNEVAMGDEMSDEDDVKPV